MGKPPAAGLARYCAGLPKIALKAIGDLANNFEPKPGRPGPAFCSYRASAEPRFRPFSSRQGIPALRKHLCEIRRDHLMPLNRRRDWSCFRRLTEYGNCAVTVPGIAMIQFRFYDLPALNATPISGCSKSACVDRAGGDARKGLVNLIAIPLVNQYSGLFCAAITCATVGDKVLHPWKRDLLTLAAGSFPSAFFSFF